MCSTHGDEERKMSALEKFKAYENKTFGDAAALYLTVQTVSDIIGTDWRVAAWELSVR